MSRYMLFSEDLLILRDGRPFGDTGSFGGTALDWPLPQTLAGMCRTALGHGISRDAFDSSEILDGLLNLGMEKILPCLMAEGKGSEAPEILLPFPADLVCMEEEEGQKKKQRLYPLSYSPLKGGEGTDWKDKDWLYPGLSSKGKPKAAPRFLRKKLAEAYLAGTLEVAGQSLDRDGETVEGPVRDFRIHVALDPETRTVEEGRLYGESGIYLKAVKKTEKKGRASLSGRLAAGEILGDLGIAFSLKGLNPEEKMPEALYLGGERRRVDIAATGKESFPVPGKNLENQRFLKFFLTTHGDFGGWAPDWLVQQTEDGAFAWVKEPRSGMEIRLRSAVVTGWEPVSGWDLKEKKPKVFRKLVRPGAVYLIEMKNPSDSLSLVQALWGRSLCLPESRGEKDGFGQILIARASTLQNGKDAE